MSLDIRLTAVRLLANTGQPEIREQFRELTVRRDLCEELRTALLEGMYKLDQAMADDQEPAATLEMSDESLRACQPVIDQVGVHPE